MKLAIVLAAATAAVSLAGCSESGRRAGGYERRTVIVDQGPRYRERQSWRRSEAREDWRERREDKAERREDARERREDQAERREDARERREDRRERMEDMRR